MQFQSVKFVIFIQIAVTFLISRVHAHFLVVCLRNINFALLVCNHDDNILMAVNIP